MNSVDDNLLDRIEKRAKDDDLWSAEIVADSLKTVVKCGSSEITISEGTTNKSIDPRVVNFVSMAVFDPKWTFDALRAEAPNNGDELIDEMSERLVNAPSPQVERMDEICRTSGFVKEVARLGMKLAGDRREDNYGYRLFNVLARAETKLNVGVNPLGPTKEVYARDGAVRIVTDDPRDEGEVEVTSAADW